MSEIQTKQFEPHPVVPVRFAERRTAVRLVECPFCGEQHTHGTGGTTGPDFGHRRAHCLEADLPLALQGLSLGYYLRLEYIEQVKIRDAHPEYPMPQNPVDPF